MQPMFFISFISVLFAFTGQEASATNIYVTPIYSCTNACRGDLVLPYDNLIFALQAATTQDSPVIILLASDTADHYALSEEVDPLLRAPDYASSLYQISDSVFTFTTLEIKPLFCDEAHGLTLPVNTRCVDRNQTVIVYFKTIRKTITVQSQLIVQNIVFNTIEATYDYNDAANMLSYSQSICNKQRRRCCPSNEEGWYCIPAVMPDDPYNYYPQIVCNTGSCRVQINPFFVMDNSLAPQSTIQQNATFLNTHLQTFWGYAVSSFVEIRNSNFNLTFENCTADDVFFERGLVYIPLSESSGSTIKFKNMEFSNYNKWYRYNTSYWYPSHYGVSFSEGYLLNINGKYQGDISILDSNFKNAISVSRRRCENMFSGANPERYMLDPTVILQTGSEMQTNLKSLVSDTSSETFLSSLILIPAMQGSMNIENSTFKNITGMAGSVIRIIDLIEDDTSSGTSSSLTLKNSVFDGNFAMSRFANIFVISQEKDVGCPSITVLNSSFLNTLGCPGSYGNVGLFCKFRSITSSYEQEFFTPHIIIKDSKFQNNILALSNSLAIIGAYYTLLEGNVFQNNGGPSGGGLMRYTFSLSPVQWDYVNFDYNRCFGQSTAAYISDFYKLTSSGNTFRGNWSPFEGSRALGVSLTLLNWTNVLGWYEHEPDLTLQLQNDQFVDHTGVPPIVDPIVRQILNCYTPPLITLGNTNPTYGSKRPEIYLTGVKFENNIANYGSILGRCTDFATQITFGTGVLELVRDVSRFRSGFFRFITSSDSFDSAQVGGNNAQAVTDTLDNVYYQLKIYFSQGEIRNNTVEGGCLFPTLKLTIFLLDDLQIESNQVNPSLESRKNMTLKTQANTDNILNNRAGIFCGFQKASVAASWNLTINANKIKARNNIGPIFDLFPDESNYFFLMNSLFINNTCEYTSTIIASEGSIIQTSNNIFINNTNAFGTVFITSSSSSYFNAFSTYLNNDGRYASLIYGDSKTTVIQVSSRAYSNVVNPNTYLFDDNILPQGGLYFVSSSVLKMTDSIFSQNNAYAGFIISSGSTILLDRIQINDHSVFGAGLIGNFLYSSELTMTNVSITNSSITQNPVSQLEPSFITVIAGKTNIYNTNISEVPTFNKAAILIGKLAQSNLKDIILSNVSSVNGNGLLSLTLSNINVTNLYAEKTTSLFSLYLAVGSLTSIYIDGLTSSSGSLYAINVVSSTLTISKFKYIGGWDSGEYISLIAGSKNRVIVSEAYFLDALYGNNNKIFDLRESSLLLVTRSIFEYTNITTQPVIFDLESSQTVVIEKCTFSGTNQLVQDQNTKANFYFISNTIMTDSNAQAISTQQNNVVTLLNNHFISPTDRIEVSTPTSQIQIVDNSGLIKLKDSIFFSLYGSKGVVLVQCTQIPYNVESTGNTFISNTASYGGAFHLDASISNSTATLPSAVINSSTFLLNKANKIESSGSGNGGAIFQTSSTFIKQDTTITNSSFISNSAEMVGGAIFFDYMLPTVDRTSDFIKNSANLRPNHIGSYPVRLGYYDTLSQDILPALPSDTPSRLLSSSGFTQWGNMPSGITSDQSFTFVLLDMFGQIFDSDNTSTLDVYPVGLTQEERYLFSNKLSIVAVDGKYVYNSFKLTYKTYGTINVIFKSTAIQENRQPPLHLPLTPLDSLLVEVKFRGCTRGEYVIADSRTTSCGECQPGFWQTSPVPDALACDACDTTSTFCLGGDNVGPVEGYWRLNETANIVRECPITGSCLGSDRNNRNRDPRGICGKGYTGNLCSNCIPGWAKIGNGACTNCNTNVWYYLRVVLVLLVQLALIIKAVHGTLLISKEFNENQKLNLGGVILIRVLTNYFQLISLVSGMPVTWPGVIKSISATSSQAASVTENVFTLDCLFKSDHISGVKVVFIKLLLTIVGPFLLILLGILCTAIYFLIKKMPITRSRAFKNQIVSLTVIICFMMQPSAIQSAFSIFQCENLYRVDTPVSFMTKDYDVQCWEGSHFLWAFGFGLPMLLIWAIGLPYLVFRALKRNKDKLDTAEVAQKYSFLYGGYSTEKYYWELIIMFRKFTLISITLGASFHSLNLEVYVAVLMILFWYMVHLLARPYAEANLNRLEKFALISAGIINFCGLYFKIVPSKLWLDLLVIICGLGGNLLFFVYFGMLYFALQIEKIMQNKKVGEILAKIGKKCKWINPTKIENFLKKTSALINSLASKKLSDQQPNLEKSTKEQFNQQEECKEVAEDQTPATKRLLTDSFEDGSPKKMEHQETVDISPQTIFVKPINLEDPNEGENQDEFEPNESESLKKVIMIERYNNNRMPEIITVDQLLTKKDED